MWKYSLWIMAFSLLLIINGCAILKPVESKKFGDISQYKYAIVGQTQTLNSGAGSGYVGYGTSGGFSSSVSKSINPSDVIAGILMKRGFVIVDSINDDKKKAQTLLVRYGQGDKRNVLGGLGGYTLGVSIQILDFTTNDPLFTCKAEGQGETESDDIREAITRCLQDL